MEKIRVLQISKRYPPYIGGIETVVHDVSQALERSGKYQVVVLAFNDKKETVHERYEGIEVYRVGVSKVIASQPIAPQYGKVFKKIIQEFDPQIIHFHYPDPYAAHFLLKYKGHAKLILHWHADIIKQKFLKLFFLHQNTVLCKRANLILATSPAYLKDTDYLPKYKEKTAVLPLCVGEERTNVTVEEQKKAVEIRNQYANKKICFFYGRHVPYKGLTYLIQADQYLNPDKIQLVIAGSGPLTEELKTQAKPYKNIDFVGRLSDEDINAYLMASDVFVFPSITRNEAFGISSAEAMYFGKPACTFTIRGSGVNWVSIDGETGLEAPNKDVKAYASNINKLCEDNALYAKLSKGAKDRCQKYFTREIFDQKVLENYEKNLH